MGERGKKWALLIGVDRYHESLGSLKYAGADCRALREVLTSGPLGFEAERVCLLTDHGDERHRPTYANIHNALGTWLALPGEEDLVLVYFAGHGLAVKEESYLVPGDATLATVHTLGVRLGYVQEVLERCRARRKVLVVDACHSGAGRDVNTMTKTMLDGLGAGEGLYTVSSCGLNERSYEWEEKGRGVFSYFLTEALRGGCKCDAEGRLTADGVYEWVHDEVVKWAASKGSVQRPQRFTKGAGVIVLAQGEPDYKVLAEQYRRELEAMRTRIREMEDREQERAAKEEEQRKIEELRVYVSRFLIKHPDLRGAALLAKWRKFAQTQLAGTEVSDHTLERIIKEERRRLVAGPSDVLRDDELADAGSLRIVTVPPDVEARVYVDDEVVESARGGIRVSVGTHVIRLVPESMEWGVQTLRVNVDTGSERRVVARLRRATSWRAVLSFLATFAFGVLVSPVGLILPARPAPEYFLGGLFLTPLCAALYACALGVLIHLSRGLSFHAGFLENFNPPDGLLGVIVLGTTCAAWLLGNFLPLSYVFITWSIGTAVLAGILFCIVPWHGKYTNRDVLV